MVRPKRPVVSPATAGRTKKKAFCAKYEEEGTVIKLKMGCMK
jgi:hypothetical protein